MTKEPSISLGPFSLEYPIGRGGMCEVWQGVHRESGVPIAVKVILHQYAKTPSYVRAFRDEVRAVAGLHHHNIVMLFDFGQIPEETAEASGGRLQAGSPFMVMELAQGVLTPLCGQLDWPQVSWLLFSLLDGLAHAHARGVIHRDLKPGNILLVSDNHRVKITDFGLAHLLERQTVPARFQMLKGTPAYMAPEQFEGRWRDYGPWTDLYAFGCCVYAMVCGRSPYGPKPDFFAYKDAHMSSEIPPFGPIRQVPSGLWGWVERLLEKDPDLRFQRAADAAWALRQFCLELDDEPDTARTTFVLPSSPPTEVGAHIPWAVASPEPTPLSDSFVWPGEATGAFREEGEGEAHPTEEEVVWQLVASGSDTTTFHGGTFPPQPGGDAKTLIKDEGPETVSLGRHELILSAPLPPPSAPKYSAPPPVPTLWAEHDAKRAPARLLDNVGLGIFGLRTVPLVSRERERERLWNTLHEVHQCGARRAVVLEGASGCGKSRLAEWFCERAHEVGAATVLQAHHSPLLGAADGLAPMLHRFFRAIGLSRKAIHERLAYRLPREGILEPGVWPSLTQLLAPPDLESLPTEQEYEASEEADAAAHERSQLLRFGTEGERHRTINQVLNGLRQERSVVIWLDDVQWGVETLSFVQQLLQPEAGESEVGAAESDAPEHGILVVMTAQTEALSKRPEATKLLAQMSALPECEVFPLRPLSAQAQLQLIHMLLGVEDSLAQQLCDHTEGNPLFVVQMLGDWVQRGSLQPGPEGFCLKHPEDLSRAKDLHQVWLRRIMRLLDGRPESDKIALELAAALGHEVEPREWEEVCGALGIAPPHTLVDLLLEQRLARRAHEVLDGSWSFVHVLLRESLARQAREEGRWAGHHRACAEMLMPPQDRYQKERIGRHLLAANDPRAALPTLLNTIHELVQTGDFRHANSLLDELKEVLQSTYPKQDHFMWGELWLLMCQLARGRGDYQSAGQWAQYAVTHARREGWREVLGEALIELGIWGWRSNEDVDGAAAYFQESHSLACTLRDRKLQALSQRFLGALWGWQGHWERAKPQLRQAHDVFVAVDDPIGISQCLLDLAEAERQLGALDAAKDYAQRALHHLASYGNRRGIAGCFNILGDIARLRGDLEQAEQHYRDSQTLNHAIGSGRSAISTLNIGIVLIERGHLQEARAILMPPLAIFARRGLKGVEGFAHVCLLSCAADAEDWDAWETHSQQAEALLLRPGCVDVDAANLLQSAAKIAAAKDATAQATDAYRFSMHVWEAIGNKDAMQEINEALSQL